MPRSVRRSISKQKTLSVPTSPPRDFAEAFYKNVLPADLDIFSHEDRSRMASSIWSLAVVRRPGEAKLRVFNPSPEADGWTVDHTVIEIINDDMPFLVDSVTGILQNRGLAVHIVIHPVIPLRRGDGHKVLSVAAKGGEGVNAESFMHIQIDHCLDKVLLKSIEDEVRATLTDVKATVTDWHAMRGRMQDAIDGVVDSKNKAAEEDSEEVRAFLAWLLDDNFTFLGYREIDLGQQGGASSPIRVTPKRGLGILRDDEARMFGGLRDTDEHHAPALRKYLRQHQTLFVTKTHAITRVHRVLPMDAVFVRRFDAHGVLVSERLFVGLFTSKAYTQTPCAIPMMRRKIVNILTRMDFTPRSHNGRTLLHILNTYPHDELLQISEDELYTNVLGILQLQDRARVALFMRRDPFDRYATFLVYVPRDRYGSTLRKRIQKFLETSYVGKILTWNVRIEDSRLARVFVMLRLTSNSPHPDLDKVESDLREMSRTWSGRLRDSLVEAHGEAAALALLNRYVYAFPEAYRETVSSAGAVRDIRNLERVRVTPRFIVNIDEVGDGRLRLKLLQPHHPLLLSESLPLIENMGLKIDYMGGPYEVKIKDATPIYIHEFVGKPALPLSVPFNRIKPVFEDALAKVWSGEVENDAFNALTLRAGLGWNAIVVLRSFARYLRQLRIPYSHDMIAAALLTHPQATQQLYALFYTRHDPMLKGDRAAKMGVAEKDLSESFAKIDVLEEDRIMRRYLNLVQASLRTNYFQTDAKGAPKSYLSIKFDSRTVDFMPLPKPLVEVFVYSPVTEAVHLRGGKVARGGIRWSDRRDDFRAEILGLMKAQMVKNSVIVPVGSKGGFIVKRPPAESDKFQAEGIACYKIMMRGLLDITDNSKNGKIVPPPQVVRHDGEDPYLVVAADKGTAKFSDIANGLSRDYGFWLDDAFASGGSAGYDHKGMGITARGAWEAVKRHFRELDKDIQTQDFTCIGIGDMSGDVFGNGVLLSPRMQLLGAFDHRHIFCDPAPDVQTSYAERQRLFLLPRSSWNDYDRKAISKGGGVFSRADKVIKISAEMKKAYGINTDTLPPVDLMRAMVKADIELLYFGGIGTYVKATSETQDEAGDRANESLRVNGAELRAKVVGEGANLGMTQRGRIEYAQKGGRLNTDAIDNSAGVDTSDHEVNIKILLRKAVDRKTLTYAARDKLLASMTDEIGHLVLRDNYLQTQVLSVAEAQAAELFPTHVRCMQLLEKSGLLNRAVEYLPGDVEIAERQKTGKGLTRPELSVLLAYAKLWLYQKILDSALPDDPALDSDVSLYFPEILRRTYAKDIAHHQLRREIAATAATNDIINHAGLHVILTMAERNDVESVVRAYLLARDAFALPQIWAGIEALDNKVPAPAQTRMLITVHAALAQAIERLLSDREALARLAPSITTYRKGLIYLAEGLARAPAFGGNMTKMGEHSETASESLARRVALFQVLVEALDLIRLADKHHTKVGDLAAIFFGLEKRLAIGWLTHVALGKAQTPWQQEAATMAREKLATTHRTLTAEIVAKKLKGKQHNLVAWEAQNAAKLERYDAMLAEGRATGAVDLAMLLLANERLSELSV